MPEELRTTIAAKGWKSPADLGTAYLNASKLIGNNIERPKPDWDDKKWGEFFTAAGRPETPDKYELGADLLKEKNIQLDGDRVKKWRENFHKYGLSAKQAKAIWEDYLRDEVTGMEAVEARDRASREASEMKLRNDWGGNYEDNVRIANSALSRVAPGLAKRLIELGLANDPELVTGFYQIGTRISEDSAHPGGGPTGVRDAGTALAEISKLSGDLEFQKALNSRDHPGHQGAVDRWRELFVIAHGTQPVNPT